MGQQHIQTNLYLRKHEFQLSRRTSGTTDHSGKEDFIYLFQVGQHRVGAPQLFFIPFCLVTARAVDTGMGETNNVERLERMIVRLKARVEAMRIELEKLKKEQS